MNENPVFELTNEIVLQTADLLDQSMAKIEHCVGQLNENQIWWRPAPSMNSIGNLMLHLAGNLRQWGVVPFTLANDLRDREAEFREDARQDSQQVISLLRTVVKNAKEEWGHLAAGQLRRKVEIQGFEVTRLHAIVHSSSHFVGHTHQIIQLTRMQKGADYQFHWTPEEVRGDLPI